MSTSVLIPVILLFLTGPILPGYESPSDRSPALTCNSNPNATETGCESQANTECVGNWEKEGDAGVCLCVGGFIRQDNNSPCIRKYNLRNVRGKA